MRLTPLSAISSCLSIAASYLVPSILKHFGIDLEGLANSIVEYFLGPRQHPITIEELQIAFFLLAISVVLYLYLAPIARKYWSRARHNFRRPSWNVKEAVLNCPSGHQYASNWSIKGQNNSQFFILIKACYIMSNVTSDEVPVRIATPGGGYLLPESLKPIPPGGDLVGCAMFYDPEKLWKKNGELINGYQAGISIDEFRRLWGSFIFVFSYVTSRDGKTGSGQVKTQKHSFDSHYVWRQLAEQSIGPMPRKLES